MLAKNSQTYGTQTHHEADVGLPAEAGDLAGEVALDGTGVDWITRDEGTGCLRPSVG